MPARLGVPVSQHTCWGSSQPVAHCSHFMYLAGDCAHSPVLLQHQHLRINMQQPGNELHAVKRHNLSAKLLRQQLKSPVCPSPTVLLGYCQGGLALTCCRRCLLASAA